VLEVLLSFRARRNRPEGAGLGVQIVTFNEGVSSVGMGGDSLDCAHLSPISNFIRVSLCVLVNEGRVLALLGPHAPGPVIL
jgi:hypothetical protein